MRGTPAIGFAADRTAGIIPAYAGNTQEWRRADAPLRDHPRVCGEHPPPLAVPKNAMGSSPRMRGTRACCGMFRSLTGIIPAYAGNTFIADLMHAGHGDHPRVCGEHFRYVGYCDMPAGSSPRMRGTLVDGLGRPRAWRIIPAYAGNTQDADNLLADPEDHPRVCGEHVYMTNPDILDPGSSPRMRGTPDQSWRGRRP